LEYDAWGTARGLSQFTSPTKTEDGSRTQGNSAGRLKAYNSGSDREAVRVFKVTDDLYCS